VSNLLWQHAHNLAIGSSSKPTRAQNIKLYTDNKLEIDESIAVASGSKGIGGDSALAFFHLLFARVDKRDADHFIGRLKDGVGLTHNSPIMVARNRLLNDYSLQKINGRKAMLLFKAWNMYRQKGLVEHGRELTISGQLPHLI